MQSTSRWRLMLLVWVCIGLSLLLSAYSGSLGTDHVAIPLLILGSVAIAVLCYVANIWPLAIVYRSETPMVTLKGVPLAIGLVFLGSLPTFAGMLIGMAIFLIVNARQSGQKLLVNLSGTTLEVWVAAAVLLAIAGQEPTMSDPLGWVAVGAAVAASDLVASLVVLTAIIISGGPLQTGSLKGFVVGNAITSAVGIPLAVLAALTLSIDVWAALLLVHFAVLLAQTNRQRHEMSKRYGAVQRLYEFISGLSKTSTTESVLHQVLERSKSVSGASKAELLLVGTSSATVWQQENGTLVGEDVSQASAVALLAMAETGRLIDAQTPVERPVRPLFPDDFDQVLLGGFTNAELRGVLMLTDRAGSTEHFDAGDVQQVVALAGHAGTALASSHLLSQVQSEAVRRQRMALRDAATGLPNRNGLLDDRPRLPRGAVFVVGIRDMPAFGTSFGHEVSESIAVRVAGRLPSEGQESGATVARIGPAHFAVRVDRPCDRADAEEWARRLVNTASGPVRRGGLVIDVGVRVGVALAPQHGTDMAELLRAGDLALISAQDSHRSFGWFQIERDRETTRRLELASELRAAIDGDNLRLAFQPQVDLATGRVVGVEALARWPHTERGFISPDEFIDIAERTGLIKPLTMWATETAVAQAAAWRARGLDISVAINLSNAAVVDKDISWDIVRIIESHDLPPRSVIMEITESQLLYEHEGSNGALAIFNAAGIQLSVDDFGTGYSSLAHLKTLQVNELKIDRTFIQHIEHDRVDQALCAAMVTMARELGLRVVAEGIETPAARDILQELGCDIGQGYHFEHPLPASEIPRAIAELEAITVHGTVTRLQPHAKRRGGN
ncbi:hypothetical protein BH24ACT15_BH24ACT15_33890 [soil metagenome]